MSGSNGGDGSTSGSNGLHGIGGSGGSGGSATGGNTVNQPGSRGGRGGSGESESKSQSLAKATTGNSVANSYSGYTTRSQGNGNSTAPTAAYAVILRGNTNNPSPSTASTLSLLPTDSTLTVDWTNSGDPVQTGTRVVYNTDHVPTSADDGISVDIPVAQATATTFAVDGEEQQTDNKKQSYIITGLSNDKLVYVALFPYDANKKYGIPKTDVEIPRVHSWYDTQQELQAEVVTVKAEMTDYQEYYVTAQKILK